MLIRLYPGDSTMPVTTTLRRFEFVGGGSDKFWEVRTEGGEVTVRFGRNGTNGQITSKAFPDAAAARRYADRLIRQKTGKGYFEVT
jgi:predicted DNA-binding WGR domain protein